MKKPFQTLSSIIAWSCPWFAVRQDEILLPDGLPGQYNVVTKGAAVWVLPVTAAGEIVLLRVYRHTVADWCWELVAGSVKPGQTLAAAAEDELREEIGGRSERWEYICQTYTANGISDEVGHFYIAYDVVCGPPAHEAAEVMEIHSKPIAEVLEMLQRHEITDAPSALLLYYAADRLRALAASINPAGT